MIENKMKSDKKRSVQFGDDAETRNVQGTSSLDSVEADMASIRKGRSEESKPILKVKTDSSLIQPERAD